MTKHLTHFIKHNYHPELRHTGIGPLPAPVIPAQAGIHCKPPNPHKKESCKKFLSRRGGGAVLVPSTHNPYSSPMTNITHKPGIQTIPPPSYRRRPVSIVFFSPPSCHPVAGPRDPGVCLFLLQHQTKKNNKCKNSCHPVSRTGNNIHIIIFLFNLIKQ